MITKTLGIDSLEQLSETLTIEQMVEHLTFASDVKSERQQEESKEISLKGKGNK